MTDSKARLQELYKLEEKVRAAILGHPVEDRFELHRLQQRVHEEIRELLKEIYAPRLETSKATE